MKINTPLEHEVLKLLVLRAPLFPSVPRRVSGPPVSSGAATAGELLSSTCPHRVITPFSIAATRDGTPFQAVSLPDN